MSSVCGGELDSREVVAIRVDATSYREATCSIVDWATAGHAAYVCVANVHMTMEAHDDPSFRQVVNGASLVVPDGLPLVWALKRMGVQATRVRGPDLTLWVAREAARKGLHIGIYGGSPEVAEEFALRLRSRYPDLVVSAVISPPFRQMSADDEASFARQLKESGAKIVLVGLGCPKQEKWMARNVDAVGAVMIGVGAAFDLHAGKLKEAPIWMQKCGLEWLFRLWQEPHRLWRRYATHNPRFVGLLAAQLLLGIGAARHEARQER
jgi:N-acetylglucosaminyldiphosphoundecaprenol N-acetyl-beta-D-mannosaminyltransferase